MLHGNVDTTTALTDAASARAPRSAASTNGVILDLPAARAAVRYATLAATTSTALNTTPTTLRQVNIFAGQLYTSAPSGSFRLATVGTGTPTTQGRRSPTSQAFLQPRGALTLLLRRSVAVVSGPDTLYVADDSASAIQKYSLVGGNWTANGALPPPYPRSSAAVSGTP